MADYESEKSHKDCKIFVGGLDGNSTKEDLTDHFIQFGEIIDSVVMTDPNTKKSRCFGFVTFKDPESVDECLKSSSKPHIIDGREVEAKRAVPREETSSQTLQRTKKVFLGGLSPDTTKEDIREVLEAYGAIVDVSIMTEKNTNKPRGFGFAIFDEYDSVDKLCNSKKFHRIKERDVEVKKAVSQDEMRKKDGGGHRAGGQGGGGDHYGRGAPYGGRGAYGGRGGYQDYSRMSGYPEYPRYPTANDYGGMMRSSHDYYSSVAGYSDRSVTASAYGAYGAAAYRYPGTPGYPDAYSNMYGHQNPGTMGTYNQSASAYGPSRGYPGSGGDMSKDRDHRGGSGGSRSGGGGGGYHPYKRY